MKIQENIILKDFTTFKIGGQARYFCVVKLEADLHEAIIFAKSRKLPFFVLGGGSNILISDKGFSGLVIKNEIKGVKFTDMPAGAGNGDAIINVEIGSGELLDDIVSLSVNRNLYGMENLSGIPGTIGGAAVQNAGAYGTELKDILLSVQGVNSTNGKKFVFSKKDCQCGYRNSIFKKNSKYVIVSTIVQLSRSKILHTGRAGLQAVLAEGEIDRAVDIREKVLQLRRGKLPDWHKVGTAGSFFMNPIITVKKFEELKEKFPEIVGFEENKGKVKVSLAWMMDNICKLNGYKEINVGLYEKQPIVLVNLGGATSNDVINFSEKIKKIVQEKTGIEIEEEVTVIKM